MSRNCLKCIQTLSLVALTTTLIILVLGSNAHAFTQERLRQGILVNQGNQLTFLPERKKKLSDNETIIFDSLAGVTIVDRPSSVAPYGAAVNGVYTTAEIVPKGVVEAVEAYLDKPVSLASIDRMTRDMVLAYQQAGLPVVNVVMPPQEIAGNAIQIIAVVGRLGNVHVAGDVKDPDYYKDGYQGQKGEPIKEDHVISQARWKSRRANRKVSAIYSPGDDFGVTDVTFNVEESKPFSVFAGVDNTGPGSSGDYRLFSGFVWSNLWGKDHELTYQFTTSENGIDELNGHVVQYTMPIATRTDLQLSGSYTTSNSTNKIAGGSRAESRYIGITGVTQFERKFGFNFDARYGAEYKSSNSNFEFAGTRFPGAPTQIAQAFAMLNADRRSKHSQTKLFAGVWASPGSLLKKNTDQYFNASRTGAKATYAYGRAGIDQTFFLPQNWLLNIDVQAQIASARLIGSEMMYLGGKNSIRGFQENVVRGDQGAFARVELHTPAFSSPLQIGELRDKMRIFGFYDVGMVSPNGNATANEGRAIISGAGLGLNYALNKGLNAELSYGWKVRDSKYNTTDKSDSQLHFSITGRY